MKKPLAAIGLLLGLLLALTGCVKMNIDIVIKNPETADMNMVIAFKDDVLAGKSVDEFLESVGGGDPFADMPEEAVREPYAQDGYQGYRFVMKDQNLNEASVPGLDGSGATPGLELADGKFTLRVPAEPMEQEAKAMMTEMTMSVSFPGKVLEASEGAVIEGNKVTFDMLNAQGSEYMAVAESEPTRATGALQSASMTWIWWVLGGLVIVAGALVAVLVVVQRKNATRAAAAVPGFAPEPAFPQAPSFSPAPPFGAPAAPGQTPPQAPPMPPMPPAPGA